MFINRIGWIVITLFLLIGASSSQDQTNQSKTVIKQVPVAMTSPASGKEMYISYCAACHGTDGKGNGPAASALKIPPADLTT
jgi:mono/diheme cytochrome c family protein